MHAVRALHRSDLMNVQLHSAPPTGSQWSDAFVVDSPRIVIPCFGAITFVQSRRKYFCASVSALAIDATAPYRMRRTGAQTVTSVVVVPTNPTIDTCAHSLSIQQWLRLCRWAENHERQDYSHSALAIEECCLSILGSSSVADQLDDRIDSRARRAVPSAQEFIAIHAENSLRVGQIAQAVNVSPFHLMKVFKQVTGLTMHQSQLQYRITQAVSRLKDGERNLSVLALDLGFSSHAHFSKTFREHVGCSPSDFRSSAATRRL
jgi:AraC family transcriptional regulator